jgi:hypothetical protein
MCLHGLAAWRSVFDAATPLSRYMLHLIPGYPLVKVTTHPQDIHYIVDFVAFLLDIYAASANSPKWPASATLFRNATMQGAHSFEGAGATVFAALLCKASRISLASSGCQLVGYWFRLCEAVVEPFPHKPDYLGPREGSLGPYPSACSPASI